jgi:CBS domain-containing protein
MQARDIMTTAVVSVRPDTTIRKIARLLHERRISGVPVVNGEGKVLGIVSEGDLIRRPETGAERHPSWWLDLLATPEDRAIGYIKAHGGNASDVMTRDVVSVGEEASLEEIADLLEKHRIKRVPVLRDDKLIGIVSRADLLHGLVARQAAPTTSASDHAIRSSVEAALMDAGVRSAFLSVVVAGGIVHLWGAVESSAEKEAARVAAENTPGVKGVSNEMSVLPPKVRAVMWAE